MTIHLTVKLVDVEDDHGRAVRTFAGIVSAKRTRTAARKDAMARNADPERGQTTIYTTVSIEVTE